jgi:hypothetical protein
MQSEIQKWKGYWPDTPIGLSWALNLSLELYAFLLKSIFLAAASGPFEENGLAE